MPTRLFDMIQANFVLAVISFLTMGISADFATRAVQQGDTIKAVALYALSALGLVLLALPIRMGVMMAVAFAACWFPALERALGRASKRKGRILSPFGR